MKPLLLDDAVALYRDQYLAARNLAPLTRTNYLLDLKDLVRWLAERELTARVDQIERNHLERYLAHLDARGLKGSSRRRRVATLRSFFGFLHQQGLLAASPAERLIPPERERDQPRVLSEAEYKRLLEAVRYDARDAAVVELILQTGLRLSEVARLTLADVELPAKIVKPDLNRKEPGTWGKVSVHGKGRKQRTVTLNWKACRALKAYLVVRPDVENAHLFITKFGLGLGPRSIENLVAKYLKEAGIVGATVHALRHTFATMHAMKGTKLGVLRDALGHESLETTSRYVGLARELMDKELQQHAL
jgi:site-specific recombinase XerD